jgi:HlyD family secretion protein
MAEETPPPMALRPARSRRSRWFVLVVMTLLAGGGYVGYKQLFASDADDGVSHYLTAEVKRDVFLHEVVERGDVDSSSNVEVRCEVRSRASAGTSILEIVPEGTHVKEGDFLVRLDDSNLQNEVILQQISVQNSEAAVIQAQTLVETAELARQEFENGTYKQEVEEVQSLVFVAEENLRRAEEYYRYSLRLAAKGYVTSIQLEADKFAVEKAKKDLDVAETKQDVLVNFTKERTLKRLDADILAAKAKLRATKESHQLEVAQLDSIKEQITKCVIRAPAKGQVVYANDPYRSSEPLIEEGRLVRERQTLIRLPNPDKMQVVAKINESRIDLVQQEMPAIIRIDALPGVELKGRVRKVSEYPLPTSSYTSHLKNYATMVEILDPPEDLRPGMTAQVAVQVEELDNVLQVPIQAVIEKSGRHFCLLTQDGEHFEPREVAVGSNNHKFIVVRHGLDENAQVAMTPKQYFDNAEWPTLLAKRPDWKDQDEALAQQQKRESGEGKRIVVRKVPVEDTTPDHQSAAAR